MRNVIVGIMMLMLSLSWLGCNREEKPRIQLPVEEIVPDRKKVVGHLIKEKETLLEPGEYSFMPVRSDTSVFLRYSLTRNEKRLQRYDIDLSMKTSHSFLGGKGPGEWIGLPEFVGSEYVIMMIDPAEGRITWYDGEMNIVNTLRHPSRVNFGLVYSELVKRGDDRYGLYYYVSSPVRRKLGYYSGDDIKIMGGTIGPHEVDCDVYYETFKGSQKTKETVYEVGEKILFAQAGVSLYVVDAETYTLTRMSLDGVPVRSVRVKVERPEFSQETLQKWEKGFSTLMWNDHKGQWSPIWLYPNPLWSVTSILPLGNGLAVITCDDYDSDNKPEMLRADYFDFNLNYIGEIELPSYPYWNCPNTWHTQRARGYLRWQMNRLFQIHVDTNDEDHVTLSRWRLE